MDRSKSLRRWIIRITCCILITVRSSCSSNINGGNCQSSCGNITLRPPLGVQNGCGSFPYKNLLRCKKNVDGTSVLLLLTPRGPFLVQDVDYRTKTITIRDSAKSACSSLKPIPQKLLQYYFTNTDSILPPSPDNTIVLLNCSDTSIVKRDSARLCMTKNSSSLPCDALYDCPAFDSLRKAQAQGSRAKEPFCCNTDFEKLGNRSLKDLQCSHYTSILNSDQYAKKIDPTDWNSGIRLSFSESQSGNPPDIGDFCKKCDGSHDSSFDIGNSDDQPNCGVGRECVCYTQRCADGFWSSALPNNLPTAMIKMITVLCSVALVAGNLWKMFWFSSNRRISAYHHNFNSWFDWVNLRSCILHDSSENSISLLKSIYTTDIIQIKWQLI